MEISTPATTGSSAFNIFERWSQLVAIVTGLTALAGMAYNWVYLGALGAAGLLQLFSIPDEISSALAWLPGILLIHVLNILSSNISTKYTQFDIVLNRIISTNVASVTLFILGKLGFWFSASNDWQLVIAFGTMLWFSVAARLIALFGWQEIPNSGFLFYIAPMILSLIVAAGNRVGLADLAATKGDTTITMKASAGIKEPVNVINRDGAIFHKTGYAALTQTPARRLLYGIVSE